MPFEVIIIGASGHGKVIADIIEKSGDKVFGFLDDNVLAEKVVGYNILGTVADCEKYKDKNFIIAIGNNKIRKQIAQKYNYLNYYTAIHPTAVISNNTTINKGTCVMANAVINADAKIGGHCIINTSSVVEHDNTLKDFVHISPNAVLGGTVYVGEGTHIGLGAMVRNNISICQNCIIGVGAAVVKNITKPAKYIGLPAKEILPNEVF